jgi:hypothetical protein
VASPNIVFVMLLGLGVATSLLADYNMAAKHPPSSLSRSDHGRHTYGRPTVDTTSSARHLLAQGVLAYAASKTAGSGRGPCRLDHHTYGGGHLSLVSEVAVVTT